MKSVHAAIAGAALALAVAPVTLAGCGGQPAKPAATPAPSSPPAATAPASPAATPSPARTPGPGATPPAPSTPATPSPGPSATVVSSRVAYAWGWPNDVARPGRVTHAYPVPPVPELVQISAGYHRGDHGQPPYNRMSFTFTKAFPSYHFEWASTLAGDASGKVVQVAGTDPQTSVRVYEVETATAAGQHRYVVAIDISAGGGRW